MMQFRHGLACLICAFAAESSTLHAQLLSHWMLDGDLSDAAGANAGVFVGGDAPLFVRGYDGGAAGAVFFDGVDDAIRIDDDPVAPRLALSETFTLAFWFKFASIDQAQKYILSRNVPEAQYAIIYEYVEDSVEFFAGGSFSGDDPRPGNAMAITDTEWHHIAYAYDGSTLVGFIDGVPLVSLEKSFVLNPFTASWYIGAANPTANRVEGAFDDVRI